MRLKKWLEKKNMTQTTFAKKIPLTRSHLSRIANGTPPCRNIALKIEALTQGEVTAIELLFGEKKIEK